MRTLTLALLGCLATWSLSFAAESVAVPSSQTDPESRLECLLREAQVLGKPKRLYGGNDVKFIVRLNDGSPEDVRDAILSFVGRPLATEAVDPVRTRMGHPMAGVRAASVCALASDPTQVNGDHIRASLRDGSPGVRMAGVYLLSRCPGLWGECRQSLRSLFDDTSLNVRYESLRLSGRMAYSDFSEAIAAGLEEDARTGRVANFAARRDALEAITGQSLPLEPPFVWGQSTHAGTVRQSRIDLARRWEELLLARCPRDIHK